jgi:hypothetical protein
LQTFLEMAKRLKSCEQMVFYTALVQMDMTRSRNILSIAQHLTLGCGCTSDNLDEFASNDGLTGPVVKNLELVDHVAGVLGGVLDDKLVTV